jgi:hypothetical protein
MPRLFSFRLAVACALAVCLTLALTASAAAAGLSAQLRVVGSGGKVLAEKTVTAATTSVETSPKATCFGAGTGGSGEAVTIQGNTAMGLLARASRFTPSLQPLAISDHFDFGLALCGVGSSIAKGSSSWYLKINHKSLQVGGEVAKFHAGDEVLWDLAKTEAPDYKYPEELVLIAPKSAHAGMPFTVKVLAYDEKGKASPVAGAKVSGAAAPTGKDGRAKVTLSKPGKLFARAAGDIPSAREPVCVGGKCPK